MDQHDEKEDAENNNLRDSAEQRGDEAAAAEGDSGGSMADTREGRKAKESVARHLITKDEVGSGEAEASPALLAHPCSLLQLLLRACAGCLGLDGYCSTDPKPAAVAAPAAADSSQEGEGGEKANYLYMQEEVVTRVWAVRMPRPPDNRPREGDGGNGGVHH